jgi:hypothetical protein
MHTMALGVSMKAVALFLILQLTMLRLCVCFCTQYKICLFLHALRCLCVCFCTKCEGSCVFVFAQNVMRCELLFCYIMARTSHISLDDDDVRFVLD